MIRLDTGREELPINRSRSDWTEEDLDIAIQMDGTCEHLSDESSVCVCVSASIDRFEEQSLTERFEEQSLTERFEEPSLTEHFEEPSLTGQFGPEKR